ncbi:MAG: DUF11 domain-containing protein [Gemmatimonadetes bacterium]|nr:DUF11 domain-containing protein [Gemmatimonadota bacterium]
MVRHRPAGGLRTEGGSSTRRALRVLVLAAAVLAPAPLSAQTLINNTAAATYQTIAGTDSVASNSVQTTLVFPVVFLEKLLVGPSSARIGEDVSYTIRYGNSSASVPIRDAVLIDTLPLGLEFVSSQPAAQVVGQVATWNLGDVAPGVTAQITLTVRVSDQVRDTVSVTNMAVLEALNSGAADLALAPAVELIGVTGNQLSLDKSADVLEVGLGETVPYTLTLENTGFVPIADLRIHDSLPEGGRYARGSALGADSVSANERELTFFVAGPLAAGATHTVRYAVAIVSAENDVIANRAYATAENEFVRSEEVVAWVRIRHSWPMETRAAIGKVWVDRDGDGVQDADEPGVEGVDIWTDDGEVATTDSEGKFSFRNVRPGHHTFRLDGTTVPGAYRLAGARSLEDLVAVDADGWTTPRINFRVLPTMGTIEQVYLPVSWQFTARPLRRTVPEAAVRPTTIARFQTNNARPKFVDGPSAIVKRLATMLADWPDCTIEIAGHTDLRFIYGPPYYSNQALSEARALWVAQSLRAAGLPDTALIVRGYGTTQPISTDPSSSWLNRRVELRFSCPESDAIVSRRQEVEYEVVIYNDYATPISRMAVRFEPAPDSVLVLDGGSADAMDGDPVAFSHSGGSIVLPPIAPYGRLLIRAWTSSPGDSAVAVLESGDRAGRLVAPIHNPLIPVEGVASMRVPVDSLPDPATIKRGGGVELVIAPAAPGWPQLTRPLPEGWELVPGTTRIGDVPAPDPELRKDRTGRLLLHWTLTGRPGAPVSVRLRPADSLEPLEVEEVSLPALRTTEEREADEKRAFIMGPTVQIFEPTDGTVFSSDRIYIGARGEPGAAVALFDGDSLVAQANLRIDGIHDFIAVPLSRGPHRLRVRMVNSWNQERWDSMTVHVTGRPASFSTPDAPVELIADGHTIATVRVRVFDRWGVPIVNRIYATASAEGAEPVSADADPSSVGVQVRSDRAGWFEIQLKPGRDVGTGKLILQSGTARGEVDLEILPAIRPLMLTGVGRLGLGASPDAFGAIIARGRLDRNTSIIMSYDSRRLDAGRDIFGRSFDPLGEARYPLLGDASNVRTLSASRYAFSARLERGFDWLAVGDLSTTDFASGLRLTNYRRALAGGAARVTTGPIVWRGFGSLTSQNLQQLQIRGVGSSGPYELQPDIFPGTERVVIETRAKENAQRIVTQQVLVRFIDYQIDYQRGTLLFKRPVPAADPYENPVFLMVTYEVDGGGEQRLVSGMRATVNARGLLGSALLDSLRIGATGIQSEEPTGAHYLAGADMRLLRVGALDIGGEVSYSETPDSSGIAAMIDGSAHFFKGAINLNAGWMKVGSGFGNPSNTGLRGGTEEIRVGGGLRLGPSTLRVRHERQSFATQGVERQITSARIVQRLGPHGQIDLGHTFDRFSNGASADESRAGELRATWTPSSAVKVWAEARRQFAFSGNLSRPDHVAGGASFQLHRDVVLEAQHRQVLLPDGSTNYSTTSLGIRTSIGANTQAWGSYQLAGGAGGKYNAAVVGLNNRLRLGSALTVNALFERRVGLDRAPVEDPVRALPFLQAEEDYWSAGLGLELLPPNAPYRLSMRGEYRDGTALSTRLATMAGDVSINRSLAILSRQEFLESERRLATGPAMSRRLSSLWGMAFRPIKTDALNILAKFEWRDETNPLAAGVLAQQGDEQRMIGIAEMIWAPFEWTEIAGRYAMRHTQANQVLGDGVAQRLESWADYLGGRFDLNISRWLTVRSEGRLLIERTSDTRRWDAAPSLALNLIEGFEVAGGYRFGDLRDPDFSVRGGHGWFVTFGVRLTERVFPTAADFWRPRF